MKDISQNNPHLDEMKERGWAWIQRNEITGEYGAPYTDDEYAAKKVKDDIQFHSPINKDKLLIVWW